MSKLIIIEGTDNVGKDTLIESIKSKFNNPKVYHSTKPEGTTPEEMWDYQMEAFSMLLLQTVHDYFSGEFDCVIHNRSYYGEYVYGCMYREAKEDDVKELIGFIDNGITLQIKPEDICFITLLSDNVDFLIKNDDGKSISEANKEKIIEETERFKKVFELSKINNKHIVYVNNGTEFRSKEDILNEVLSYIN